MRLGAPLAKIDQDAENRITFAVKPVMASSAGPVCARASF